MRYLHVEGLDPVSKVGLGTMAFGSRGFDPSVATALVRRALELGITHFDTAEVYGFGRGERVLATALGERRHEVVVTSKMVPVAPFPAVTRRRVDGSRNRLNLPRIPLYLQHTPNPLVGDRTIMRGMHQAVADGAIGAVGVSNYGLAHWQRAEGALGQPVVANQVQFSLVHHDPVRDLVPWAGDQRRMVVAHTPLAQGLISGRYDNDPRLPAHLRGSGELGSMLQELASTHDATPNQVALAWVIQHDPVVAIPGASSIEQLEANAAAASIELTPSEHAELTRTARGFDQLGDLRIGTLKQRLRSGGQLST